MKHFNKREPSKWILLVPQKNHVGDLSRHKSDENFGLIDNIICNNQLNYQQIIRLFIHMCASLALMWKILNMILALWIHPRPYFI
jgi:hypothetical protein